MGRKMLKLYVDQDDKGRFSILYTKKGVEDSVLIEGLNQRQVELIYKLLQTLGFGVFLKGETKTLSCLKISEYAKVPIDQKFQSRRKLQLWEVLD
jgi:hypothetical protein